MKFRFFLILMALLSLCLGLKAQVEVCGFDLLTRRLKKDPAYLKQIEATETKIQAEITKIERQRQLQQNMDIKPGPIYEIPVVVHIVHKSTDAAIGTLSNPTDATIQAALDALNNNFSARPGSRNDWANIPIRFVLARRTMNCAATTGIVRYNGGALPDYDASGLSSPGSDAPGSSEDEIKNLTGTWNINNYYNIWVVWNIGSGGPPGSFVAGYAHLPVSGRGVISPPSKDGAFMKTTSMTNASPTLTHEMGHAFALYHTFQGGNKDDCPPAGACNSSGDLVCDTDPVKDLLSANPFPQDADINPCTGAAYNGVQRNIMGYGSFRNRFTPDQSTRMQAALRAARGGLATSDASLPPPASLVIPSRQIPPNIANPNNMSGMGPRNVTLGDMIYTSNGLDNKINDYYVDNTCNIGTHIATSSPQISVTTSTNRQRCKVWIDFNNDGQFTPDELVMNSTSSTLEFTHTATILTVKLRAAIKSVPLRMRVMSDFAGSPDFDPGSQIKYGQTEDFWVVIDRALPVIFGEVFAKKKAAGLLISWKTNTENKNNYFLIEGSTDGKNFSRLAKVSSKTENETTNSSIQYRVLVTDAGDVVLLSGGLLAFALSAFSFRRRRKMTGAVIAVLSWVTIAASCSKQSALAGSNQSGINYIRIAQVDIDGTQQYSKIVQVVAED